MSTLPHNPYIAGKALSDSRGFFGREDVFHEVEKVLSLPHQNSIVLSGQRRIGKTSILLNLRSRLSSQPFTPIYFDLMDHGRKPLGDVLYSLALIIAQELDLPFPPREDFNEDGRGFHEKFLTTVRSKLGDSRRLVLLFDEFDVLGEKQESPQGITSAIQTFFPYLRKLMAYDPKIGFVFVVGRKAEELGNEFKSTFKASRYYRVSVLDEEAAKSLVLCAEQQKTLKFTDEAVARILGLTRRHPYFTQLMCQLLFEHAYRGYDKISNVPTVSVSDVEAVVPKVLSAGENAFVWIWEGLPPAERVIFSAIAAGTDERTVITKDRLLNILKDRGIRSFIPELDLAPQTLIGWEMLDAADGGYKFTVELMRRWVFERKPLAADDMFPLADTLYQSAVGFYRQGMLDNAITQLIDKPSKNRKMSTWQNENFISPMPKSKN